MKSLINCPLFEGLSEEEIDRLVGKGFGIRTYDEEQVLLTQGSIYNILLIILEGEVLAEMSDVNGRTVMIEAIYAPNLIAPAILYCQENRIPVNVIAKAKTRILPIAKEELTHILQSNTTVLNNFLRLISERGRFLSEKVRLLRFGTIKSKLSGYLLEIYNRKESMTFTIKHSQQELADMFGVSRPALSKTIGQMVDEGIIWNNSKDYEIKDLDSLRELFRSSS